MPSESDDVLSELQMQSDWLNQKQTAELDMLSKLAQTKLTHDIETVLEENINLINQHNLKTRVVMSHSYVANSRFQGKLVNQVKPTS